MPSKRDVARAAATITRWYEEGAALYCLTAVCVEGRRQRPSMTVVVLGRVAIIEESAIIRAERGSFMFIPALSRAEGIEIERSWKGSMLTLTFENAGFVLADYKLPTG
jgi:hypothetical protein